MKVSEAREMSITDLKDLIDVKKKELDTMRLQHAISPMEDTSVFAQTRRDIARMITILAEKENEQK